MKAIILAGGTGTRLWPVSRKNKPKQVQPFLDSDTLLQKTYQRAAKYFKAGDIYISTGVGQAAAIKKQLPKFSSNRLILEPCKKDTAAAIGLAAVYLHHQNPKATLITINSDHYIKNEAVYFQAIDLAKKALLQYPDKTILVGIKPTYPETCYGYIHLDKKIGPQLFRVKKFVEKPDLNTAAKYVASGKYLWNPAVFCWRVDHLLSLYQKHLPQTYAILKTIEKSLDTKSAGAVLRREFKKIKPISVDYGILEKIGGDILAVAADYQFTDIGHWETLRSVLANGKNCNVTKGQVLSHDSAGNLIYNFTDHVVTVAGLHNTIIVQTPDALFVCPTNRAQDVKKIVALLEEQKLDSYL